MVGTAREYQIFFLNSAFSQLLTTVITMWVICVLYNPVDPNNRGRWAVKVVDWQVSALSLNLVALLNNWATSQCSLAFLLPAPFNFMDTLIDSVVPHTNVKTLRNDTIYSLKQSKRILGETGMHGSVSHQTTASHQQRQFHCVVSSHCPAGEREISAWQFIVKRKAGIWRASHSRSKWDENDQNTCSHYTLVNDY